MENVKKTWEKNNYSTRTKSRAQLVEDKGDIFFQNVPIQEKQMRIIGGEMLLD